MSFLADWEICHLARKGMITPFEEKAISRVADLGEPGGFRRVISYGVGSYGYDLQLARAFKLFHPYPGVVMDPKKPDPRCFLDIEEDEIVLPAHSYMLGKSVETYDIPEDILVLCIGKSTYARVGITINVTPLEPGWRGEITMEIGNPTPVPVRVYASEGIGQLIFSRNGACHQTYKNKVAGGASKYQDQKGITLSTV